jgi:hypothetical protein
MSVFRYVLVAINASHQRLRIKVKTLPIHGVKAMGQKFFSLEGHILALDFGMSLKTAFFHRKETQLVIWQVLLDVTE